MPADPTPPRTRRALLTAVAGAAGAWAASAVAAAAPVAAANGDQLKVGSETTASGTTTLTWNATSGTAFLATGTGAAAAFGTYPGGGLVGQTTSTGSSAVGVRGETSNAANYGVFSSGKAGVNGPLELWSTGVPAKPGTGKTFLHFDGTSLTLYFPAGTKKVLATF